MPGKSDEQKPLTVTIDGEQVPKALLTAFAQPTKDKKPFSYFPGGDKPDLTHHPSPSAVRKSNPLHNAPHVPKVLPIVTQQDLDIEEHRSARNQDDMATLTHAQYNSPMPLYSRQNVQDVLNQTQDFLGKEKSHSGGGSQFDHSQSGAYRLLQENGQIAPSHSARLDEQKDEYPHYRGFVDPRVQSPSFKRLQYVTGMDSGAEDEISHELHPPVKSRLDDMHSGAESRQSDYSYQSQQQPVQAQEYKPHWNDEIGGPRVAQRDPVSADRDQPTDPTFASRIAEAERPKVPPSVVPSWARKAEEKSRKWQQYGDNYTQRNYEYQPPTANWEPAVHKVQDKWSAHYGTTRFDSYENQPRARSAEPYHRARNMERQGGRKEWMKPFIAPNLLGNKFGPPARPSYSPLSSYRSTSKPPEFAITYPSTDTARPYSSLSTTSSNYQRGSTPYSQEYTTNPLQYTTYQPQTQSRYQSSTTRQDYTTSSGYSTPKKEVNMATLVSDEALSRAPHETNTAVPWSRHADYKRSVWDSRRSAVDPDYHRRGGHTGTTPPWAQRAEQTHSLWQNEADAWKQRQRMEQDLGRRAVSAVPEGRYESTYTNTSSLRGSSPSWRHRPVPHQVTTPQRWQGAPGGETKTQSSGSYLDRDGNQVTCTKESYTSSDPGKEYSMLSEQEKKILEEPMQPGVVSRHVTTKYYKKTTHNSSTTTSTSQSQPVTTSVTYDYPPQTTSSSRYLRGQSEF